MTPAAIDKGMPIEQIQRLLGHEQIDIFRWHIRCTVRMNKRQKKSRKGNTSLSEAFRTDIPDISFPWTDFVISRKEFTISMRSICFWGKSGYKMWKDNIYRDYIRNSGFVGQAIVDRRAVFG